MVQIAAYSLRGLDHENYRELKVEITCLVAGEWKRRRRYFQRLGIELEDLIQGVAERLARIDRRIRKGEFKPKRGTEKTWKSSHVKWAVNDVVRAYQWSGSTYDREKSKDHSAGREQRYVCEVYGEEEEDKIDVEGKPKIREGKYPAYQVEEIEARETLRAVLEIVQSCSLRVQGVFFDYFVRERTMIDISVDYDVTESRICQLVRQIRTRIVRGLMLRGMTEHIPLKMIEDVRYR